MDSVIENFSKLDAAADDEGQTENRCPMKVNNSPSSSLLASYKIPRTLTEANLALLESKRYTDVTFIVGSTRSRFPCHKLILIARSSEFARLFGPREDGGKELKEYAIPDTTHYIFPLFLKFIYTDIFVGISQMQAVDLLYLIACKFKVGLLEEHCVMYLVENVNLPVAPSVFAAGQKTQLTHLCDLALDIMAKDFETVLSSTEFLNLDQGTQETILKKLLARNNLPGSEMDILNHVIKWGKKYISHTDDNNEKLKNNLSSILPFIRFTKMRMFEFANYVVPMSVLPHDIVLNILTYLGATGSVSAEYEKKLNDLHFSTTPRYPTISTGSVIAPVSFYCATATPEEPQTRELGPLIETLRFRVQLKRVVPVTVNQEKLLLTRIYLNLPQGLNASAKVPTTKQTENKKVHVEVQKLSSSLHAKQVIFAPSMVNGPNERLEVIFSTAIELLDGFDYCIVVEDATSPKLWYKCSPCGVLKSYVWIKGLESVAKLCDIQRNAYRCVEPDLGVSIIRGLELKMAGPENSLSVAIATALKEPVNFQFSFVKTSSGHTPSISPSTVGSTESSVGLLASTTSTVGSPVITATSTFGSTAIPTTSKLGSPAIPTTSKLGSPVTTATATLGSMAITTSAIGSPAITKTSTFGSPAMKTTTKFVSPASTTPSLIGSAVSTTPLFGSAVSTTPLFGSAVSTKPTLFVSPTSTTSSFGMSTRLTTPIFGSSASVTTPPVENIRFTIGEPNHNS